MTRHLGKANLSLEGMGSDNRISNTWLQGKGDILGTAAAYIIFNPKGRGKKTFPFKSALVNLNSGGKNLEQKTKYVICEAFWDKANGPQLWLCSFRR